jgi:hypothetical protein
MHITDKTTIVTIILSGIIALWKFIAGIAFLAKFNIPFLIDNQNILKKSSEYDDWIHTTYILMICGTISVGLTVLTAYPQFFRYKNNKNDKDTRSKSDTIIDIGSMVVYVWLIIIYYNHYTDMNDEMKNTVFWYILYYGFIYAIISVVLVCSILVCILSPCIWCFKEFKNRNLENNNHSTNSTDTTYPTHSTREALVFSKV